MNNEAAVCFRINSIAKVAIMPCCWFVCLWVEIFRSGELSRPIPHEWRLFETLCLIFAKKALWRLGETLSRFIWAVIRVTKELLHSDKFVRNEPVSALDANNRADLCFQVSHLFMLISSNIRGEVSLTDALSCRLELLLIKLFCLIW